LSKCLRVMHEHGRLDYEAFSRFISAYSTILNDLPLRPPRWAADRPELSEEDRSFWWALHHYANRYVDEIISAPDTVSAVDVENLGFLEELGSGDERRLLAAVVLRQRYLRGDLEAESVSGSADDTSSSAPSPQPGSSPAHPGGRVMGDRRAAMAQLSGADLSRANLIGTDLSEATLLEADLSGADLSGARGVTKKNLEESYAKLEGATMPDGSIYH
jgi:hypothetical protein